MCARARQSVTSSRRHTVARSPHVDLYNGSTSKEFCNSFWGEGDAGINIVLARMRGAIRTTEELKRFWEERLVIEEQYATQLKGLAKMSVGGKEIGELRYSIDTLCLETEKQAAHHFLLASQIRAELEGHASRLLSKQRNFKNLFESPIVKKYKAKHTQEALVRKSHEKYEADFFRIASYMRQISSLQGHNLEKAQRNLYRVQQAAHANESDLIEFAATLSDMMLEWEEDWKKFCDMCQDMEEERIDLLRDNIWTYANAISTLCVSDDESCERLRVVLDQLEPQREIENFVQEYGTGNTIPGLPVLIPGRDNQQIPSSTSNGQSVRIASFTRKSSRSTTRRSQSVHRSPANERPTPWQQDVPRLPSYHSETPSHMSLPFQPSSANTENREMVNGNTVETVRFGDSRPPQSTNNASDFGSRGTAQIDISTGVINMVPPEHHLIQEFGLPHRRPPEASLPLSRPVGPYLNVPLEALVHQSQSPWSPPIRNIIFYVEANYDYKATFEDDFDFEQGDIIAVTSTPDDGWWNGELLDDRRRQEGKRVFPSNFVSLF